MSDRAVQVQTWLQERADELAALLWKISFTLDTENRSAGFRMTSMTLEGIDPADLASPQTYTHVMVATGTTLVFVAGQVAEDRDGNLLGRDDFATQARHAFANLGRALAAAGARPDQVAKITIFVVGYRDACLPAIEEGRRALFGEHKPVDTLVGVESLAHPGCLIEVDAVAVLDTRRGRHVAEP